MLFDPKWEVEVKADPFSLESLIAWLEKQPADKAYDFGDTKNCLACQYFRAMGMNIVGAGGGYVRSGECAEDYHFHNFGRITVRGDWTFGAALERARVALALQP